jgi:hypothetical protein
LNNLINPFRDPAAEAASNARLASDLEVTQRLRTEGCVPAKRGPLAVLVDLASRGGIVVPDFGDLLPRWRLLQGQGSAIANRVAKYLNPYAESRDPKNVVSITIRPPVDIADENGVLMLNADHLAPVQFYRPVHQKTSDWVQRAGEYLAKLEILDTLLIVRHPRLLGDGSVLDFHIHWTGVLIPKNGNVLDQRHLLEEYLIEKFGRSRVWISDEPDRDFITTANYPVRRLAKLDFSKISSKNLAEFHRQSSGLRFVDTAGDLRTFQNELNRRGGTPKMASRKAPNSPVAANTDGPKLRGIMAVYLGGVVRVMARVLYYRTFADLERHYDLGADILRAQQYADDATALLLNATTNPESGFQTITKYIGNADAAKSNSKAAGKTGDAGQPDAKSNPADAGQQAGAASMQAESNSKAAGKTGAASKQAKSNSKAAGKTGDAGQPDAKSNPADAGQQAGAAGKQAKSNSKAADAGHADGAPAKPTAADVGHADGASTRPKAADTGRASTRPKTDAGGADRASRPRPATMTPEKSDSLNGAANSKRMSLHEGPEDLTLELTVQLQGPTTVTAKLSVPGSLVVRLVDQWRQFSTTP